MTVDMTPFAQGAASHEDQSPAMSSPCMSVGRAPLQPIRLAFETPGRAKASQPAPKSSRRVVKVKSRYLTSITKQRPVESGEKTPRRQSLAKTPKTTTRASSIAKSKTQSVSKSKGGHTSAKTPSIAKTKTPSVAKSRKTPGRPSASDLKSSISTTTLAASDKASSRSHLMRKAQALANTIIQAAYTRALLEQNFRKSEQRFENWAGCVASAVDALMKSTVNIRLALQRKQVYKAVDDVLGCHGALTKTLSNLKIASEQNGQLAVALEKFSLQLPASGVCWDSDVVLLRSLQSCRQALEKIVASMSNSARSFAALSQALDELTKIALEQDSGLLKAETLIKTLTLLESAERSLQIHLVQLSQPGIL